MLEINNNINISNNNKLEIKNCTPSKYISFYNIKYLVISILSLICHKLLYFLRNLVLLSTWKHCIYSVGESLF